MKSQLAIIGLAITTGACGPALADGLLYELPEDGAWVEYDLKLEIAAGEMSVTTAGTCQIASVGRSFLDGKHCRWIEVELKFDANDDVELGDVNHVVGKLLIPVEHLARGRSPLDHMIRGWLKQGDREPAQLRQRKLGTVRPFLAGPLKNEKQLQPISIDTALGKLECPGVAGTVTWLEGDATYTATIESRLHEESPFGVVSSSVRVTSTQQPNAQMTWSFVLRRTGADSKSKLADHN